MKTPDIADLRNVIALSDLPDEHLQWILDRSEYVEFNDGDLMFKTGDPVNYMMMILEGSATFYMDVNGKLVYYFTFENNKQTGGIGGVLPYSRMTKSPGYSYATGHVRGLRLHKDYFHELEILNADLIQKLIAYMTDRARAFATMQLQQEKVSALGKLSAGLAHELNNPASAINRISHEMDKRLIRNFDMTERLLFHKIDHELINYLRKLVETVAMRGLSKGKMSALERMDKEDEINEWLEQNNIAQIQDLSETFADTNVGIEELDEIKKVVGIEACADVLRWLENLLSSQKIINDLEQASGRISKLVGAIKSHVHMDRTYDDVQPTSISDDIENTLTLLGYKLRDKNITITRKFDNHLPEVEAFVGELNQVWMNIIDNAIFAMDRGGNLTIELHTVNNDFKVNIIDNGTGIPADVLPKIFDPFYTTKKVGEGTGIGLDIVSRIITRHQGDIKVHSVPGRTEFMVCLPIHQKAKPDLPTPQATSK